MLRGKLFDRATQGRFLRFLAVGGLSAVVQFGVLLAIRNHYSGNVAYFVSLVSSTVAHYLLNRFWALPSGRSDHRRQLGEYILTVAVSYLINMIVFGFCHSVLGWDVLWAAGCALPASTLAVFLLLNYRVFRSKA